MVIVIKEFSRLHPVVSFIYLAVMIGFSMFLMHPVFLGSSLACALICAAVLKGKRACLTFFTFLPIAVLTAVLNPLFNHRGMTIITYFESGNPLTLESVIFGISAGVLLLCVTMWFSCFNAVMTSDKLICVLSRVAASLSLVLAMILRFIPRFRARLHEVSNAQKGIGRSMSHGGLVARMRSGAEILSAMITWSLENAVDVSDSMRARGYGVSKRSAYTTFVFSKRDFVFLISALLLSLLTLAGILLGYADFSYFPVPSQLSFDIISLCVYTSYILLGLMPAFLEITEVIRWKSSASKM